MLYIVVRLINSRLSRGKDRKMEKYIVYSEDYKKRKEFNDLATARAYRYQQYGYSGFIMEVDEKGTEITNYS